MKHLIHGLYAITDPQLCPNNTLLAQVTAAIKGGAKVIQYRDKTQPKEVQYEMAARLSKLCHANHVCFIVNDDIAMAKASKAHGIHLGKDDSALETARAELGTKAIIGISCYNSIERALQMQNTGADYVAFGRFFPSKTKPDAPQADLSTLRLAKQELEIPIVSIGGIDASNAEQVIKAGADSIAVIQGVFKDPNLKSIERLCRQLNATFESGTL